MFDIALKYDQLDAKITDILSEIEHKQFELKIGTLGHNNSPSRILEGDELKRLKFRIRDKHGRIKWGKEKKKV